MTAALVSRLRADGYALAVEGDNLRVEGPALTSDLRDEIKNAKRQIIRALVSEAAHANPVWKADDWQVYYDERAAIAEFDGGLPRHEAEARALECCISEMMNQTPVNSADSICAHCGRGDEAEDRLQPAMVSTTGRAWLHWACWEPWFNARRDEARAALSEHGIAGG